MFPCGARAASVGGRSYRCFPGLFLQMVCFLENHPTRHSKHKMRMWWEREKKINFQWVTGEMTDVESSFNKMFKVAPLQRSDCDCSPRVLWTTSQHVLQSRETGDRWLTCGQSTSLLAEESWPRLNFSHSADVNSQRNMHAPLSTPRTFSFVNITLAGTSAVDEKLLTALKASQLPYNFCSNTHSICRSPELTRWKFKDFECPVYDLFLCIQDEGRWSQMWTWGICFPLQSMDTWCCGSILFLHLCSKDHLDLTPCSFNQWVLHNVWNAPFPNPLFQ